LLNRFVEDTYDFNTDTEQPCSDEIGHGTRVSGIAVYGGSCDRNTLPKSRIIMAKAGFDHYQKITTPPIQLINRTIEHFASKCRVLNLSFAAEGPNPELTKALDDIIYYTDSVIVACAGNSPPKMIEEDIEKGLKYPVYLRHPIFFPGDSANAITVGSFASIDSSFCRRNSPSPFTRVGLNIDSIKPELLEEGGNIDAIKNGKVDCTGVGIRSASFRHDREILEDVGTSFASPAVASLVANIVGRYPVASSFLAKSILLSSCSELLGNNNNTFKRQIQGFGRPNSHDVLNSFHWRVSYLLQDIFSGNDPLIYHRYRFLFPNDADRLTLTLVCGKPAGSKGYLNYRVHKSGTKISSKTNPNCSIGSGNVKSTFQGTFEVKRGGRGIWSIDVIPHFDQTFNIDHSLKYGCVLTIESSKNLDIYLPISKWMSKTKRPMLEVIEPTIPSQ
jgi:hypothetical protein